MLCMGHRRVRVGERDGVVSSDKRFTIRKLSRKPVQFEEAWKFCVNFQNKIIYLHMDRRARACICVCVCSTLSLSLSFSGLGPLAS